jgi:hypothetical protein
MVFSCACRVNQEMSAECMAIALSLLKVFWLLLPAVGLVKLFNSKQWKGLIGEWRVRRLLRQHLDRKVYQLFSNLLLPVDDGGTTQIDCVLVSLYGIFVIEVKNMQGCISGGATERFWTQQIGSFRRGFQNPVHQNYKHLKTLQKLTGIREACLISLIVFADKAVLADKLPENVIQSSELVLLIKSQRKRLLTVAQTEAAVKKIHAGRLKNSLSNRRRHVWHVRTLAAHKAERPKFCPLCNSPMILRQARRGSNAGRTFWGCARFPDCRGTRQASSRLDQ